MFSPVTSYSFFIASYTYISNRILPYTICIVFIVYRIFAVMTGQQNEDDHNIERYGPTINSANTGNVLTPSRHNLLIDMSHVIENN